MRGGLGLDRKATPSGGDLSLAGGEGRVSPCSVLHDGELSVGGDADAGTDRRSRGVGGARERHGASGDLIEVSSGADPARDAPSAVMCPPQRL
jgi:hypothetical protein